MLLMPRINEVIIHFRGKGSFRVHNCEEQYWEKNSLINITSVFHVQIKEIVPLKCYD